MPYPNHDFVWRCFIWTGEGVLYHWITIKSPWNPIKLPWNQRYQHLSTLNHPSFPYISIYFHIFIGWWTNHHISQIPTITLDGKTRSPRRQQGDLLSHAANGSFGDAAPSTAGWLSGGAERKSYGNPWVGTRGLPRNGGFVIGLLAWG